MVSSIVPGSSSAAALGSDARIARQAPQPSRRDDVHPSDRLDVSGARDSVRDGLMQIHRALALGHDAQSTLLKAQGLARSGGEAQAQLSELVASFQARLDAAIAGGARLPAGDDVSVQAEPGGAPVVVAGVDLRPGADAFVIDAQRQANDPELQAAVQRSLEILQDAMSRLLDSARALEAHQGFLNAVGSTAAVRHDLDADGARLLALQVRQGLEQTSAAVANVEPQAVLSLFRV